MNIDEMNNEFYNTHTDGFDKIPFDEILLPLALKYLPKEDSDILEIGCGGGALALWMAKLGHHLTCIEPAEKPAGKAREKGLNVLQTRFQDFQASQKYDVVIAISSLIHIPRSEIPSQIQKMSQLLKRNGIAIVSFIEGDSEDYEDPTGKGKNRFFSKFTQEALNTMLSPFFSIMEIQKKEVKKMNQTFFIMVLRLL